MKNKTINITVCMLIVMLLYSISYLPILSEAAEVWTDSFDDLNYDGWTVDLGAFTCENGYLEATELDAAVEYASIRYNSSISSGTWSFDCLVVLEPPIWYYYFVGLMSEDPENTDDAFIVIEVEYYRINVKRGYADTLASWSFKNSLEGTWTHIDVTIDEDWIVNVFVNGTHRINYASFPRERDWQCFKFFPVGVGSAIDNIVVSDDIDYESLSFNESYIPTTTTTTTEPETTTNTTTTTTTDTTTDAIPIELILVGVVIAVIVVVIIVKVKTS
jgi:hypothetical protein